MNLKRRNLIAPQMSDYDRIGDRWVPYLMRVDNASKLGAVSSDEYGFRTSLDKRGKDVCIADCIQSTTESLGIVLGSSSVFGVGATGDGMTIPSLLSKDTDLKWLNYGGRAFNSTQEQIRFGLHLPKNLDKLILFSGVNNLTLAFLSASTSPVYNSFFSQTMFEEKMNSPLAEAVDVRRALSLLLSAVRKRYSTSNKKNPPVSISDVYQDILSCFRRDLRAVRLMVSGLGAEMYFVLQPLATWIDKKLSIEEAKIFSILDSMSSDWKVLAESIFEIKSAYFSDIERICLEENVEFYNMNLDVEFRENQWLFVDRVHLSDKGNKVAVDSMIREFSL